MNSASPQYDVLIIGAGPAGLMAALRAGERGKRVLVLEKNAKIGQKLSITGGGRCNILNAEDDVHALLKNYKTSAQFLYSAFSEFGMSDTRDFFETRGLPLIVEDRKRAFPKSQKAADVVTFFQKELKKVSVTVLTSTPVERILMEQQEIQAVIAGGTSYTAREYIFATGGLSHQETGSTGDGFKWLKDLGHTVHDPTPTIVPVTVADTWVKKLAGKTLPNIKLTFSNKTKKITKMGNLLCTHTGLSGPLILNTAHDFADLLSEGAVTISIDLFPNLDIGSLNKHIAGIFEANKNKTVSNALKQILPPGTTDTLLGTISTIDATKKVHSVTKEERQHLSEKFKKLTCSITGLLGFEKAVVADGGVPLTELDMKTFRSKKIENLFIVGDLLHVQRPSGGFSLQLCWTSGYVAGNGV
jgi:predicted Rossmann fold flavoprotein